MRLLLLFAFLFVGCLSLTGQTDRMYRLYTSTDYTVKQTLLGLQDRSFHRKVNGLLPIVDESAQWEEVTVPIVFHVLYTDGTKQRVTEQQIEEQIDALNRDFAGLAEPPAGDRRDPEGHFRALKVDTKIRFCVPEPGLRSGLRSVIDFRELTAPPVADLNLLKGAKIGLPPLDPQKYLNVWIAPLPEGNSGFAQLPLGKEATDGIVIDPRFFGSSGTAVAPYDQGKSLTHLIGIYLGLSPIWGEGSCSDDGISDTPVHNGPNYGYPGPGHISTCSGNPLEMTMNFMDAADDEVLYMFTREQGEWMRAVLSGNGPRGQLVGTVTACESGKLFSDLSQVAEKKSASAAPPTLQAFPNPANTVVMVRLQGAWTTSLLRGLKVYDLDGRVVYDRSISKGTTTIAIPVADWLPGVYLLRASVAEGEDVVHRIVVQ